MSTIITIIKKRMQDYNMIGCQQLLHIETVLSAASLADSYYQESYCFSNAE